LRDQLKKAKAKERAAY
jgi:hypothetical protein